MEPGKLQQVLGCIRGSSSSILICLFRFVRLLFCIIPAATAAAPFAVAVKVSGKSVPGASNFCILFVFFFYFISSFLFFSVSFVFTRFGTKKSEMFLGGWVSLWILEVHG